VRGVYHPLVEAGATKYHAAYFAHILTSRAPSDDLGKLGQSIFDASVDLNPHQLDAALFAFRSPLSRGAILADEVGLGKTIGAGLVISQLWAERKRRILVIAPTILRKQWAQEMEEKFHLPCRVLDSKDYNQALRQGRDPLSSQDEVLICSYHFAASRQAMFGAVPWSLVVIDEAHRLRNVWKPNNKIANALLSAASHKPLLLLTATPLQNSLLELYGLVSFIDEHMFGSLDAFRARYMRGTMEERQLGELRHRMQPICQRTLRRQVQEYVRFTNRIPITQDFTPSEAEQQLYEQVSDYLYRPSLHALPASQRALMTLILRKLLASSSFAISKTLSGLAQRLQNNLKVSVDAVADDFETADEMQDEWGQDHPPASHEAAANHAEILAEIQELLGYSSLASSIQKNAKGDALLQALEAGFHKLAELGAARKAVIFTESRRTQEYLLELLTASGYEGRVLTINGTNKDDRAGPIYRSWMERHRGEGVVSGNKAVDLRAALVEHFKDFADILIATEAASEGVNLQFCSLVINFDLPWNPQRIEQRIGRCHRYGQAHDVVVVNFLNRSNEADKRVFELLDEKFKLFDGVFGSSDEVLGALESGVDFERRIAEIYQHCRTREEIDAAFDALRTDLDEDIQTRMTDTRTKLLENFDEEVHKRLKVSLDQSERQLDRMERALWSVTKLGLEGIADFNDDEFQFVLRQPPAVAPEVAVGAYRFARRADDHSKAIPYRLGHPLAQSLLAQATAAELGPAELHFRYSDLGRKIGLLDPQIGESGWMRVVKLTVKSFEEDDQILAAVLTDEGEVLHPDLADALFQAPAEEHGCGTLPEDIAQHLGVHSDHLTAQALKQHQERNRRYFEEELEKLDRWAEDLKNGLQTEIKDLDASIKRLKKESNLATTLEAKLEIVRELKTTEGARNRKRRELYDAEDQIESQKDQIIETVAAKLKQETQIRAIFDIRWHLS
jgi:ERCC4-related helicase